MGMPFRGSLEMSGSNVLPFRSRKMWRATRAAAVIVACILGPWPVAADDFCYFDFDRPKYSDEVIQRVLGVWRLTDVSTETRSASGANLAPQSFIPTGSTLEFFLHDGDLSAKDNIGSLYLVDMYEGNDLNFSDMLVPFANRSFLSDGTPISSYQLVPSGMLSPLCDSGFLPVISLRIVSPPDAKPPALGPRAYIFVKKASEFGGFTLNFSGSESNRDTYSRAFFWLSPS